MPKDCKGGCGQLLYGKDYCHDCFLEKVRQETLEGQKDRIRHEDELGVLEID